MEHVKPKTVNRIVNSKTLKEGRKVGAVQVSDAEYQEVISGKLRERVQRQNMYRKAYLLRIFYGQELIEYERQMQSGTISIQWRGMTCPLEILKADFNLLLHNYKESIRNEKYLEQALKNDGLSDADIKLVIDGKYVKDEQIVEKLDKQKPAKSG